VLSAAIEDACFRVLFPSSYDHTSTWLRELVDAAEGTLFACQRQLLSALDEHPRFTQLAASCVIRARTKSLFSIMKKLLRLDDLSKVRCAGWVVGGAVTKTVLFTLNVTRQPSGQGWFASQGRHHAQRVQQH
jgi:hypothetical protein